MSSLQSLLFLRIGLAAVFLWFGVDKFIHPSYWLNAWVPQWFVGFLERFSVSGLQFIYLNGVFEVLVGVSLLSGFLMRFFSFLSVLFLSAVLFTVGFSEVTIRDAGLIGGFLSLLFWPKRRF
ncbi:MAG: DoxX family membrane protein [Candidatus Yanofskybacteria bacterium]|nr:DoxX family membrane protein [Candidatus Yanofskybacteria bacterium]